jgi:hypothetical protein
LQVLFLGVMAFTASMTNSPQYNEKCRTCSTESKEDQFRAKFNGGGIGEWECLGGPSDFECRVLESPCLSLQLFQRLSALPSEPPTDKTREMRSVTQRSAPKEPNVCFTLEPCRLHLLQHVTRHVERELVLLVNSHPSVAHEIHREPETNEQRQHNIARNQFKRGHCSAHSLPAKHMHPLRLVLDKRAPCTSNINAYTTK